ncbi:hypothetical protein L3X38_012106 [Prunus dulcis]|uniref:Uncharacterized protein n=1 Tax=Prunus dulcis TaxID=3755 RepID=A0AAD4ZFS1_PRUDU|nr:hypothetical protein L3X38_012106 [Prunus dulcis]
MVAGGGRSEPAMFGRKPGENRLFSAAGAAADVEGGLGRDAEAEPVMFSQFQQYFEKHWDLKDLPQGRSVEHEQPAWLNSAELSGSAMC